MDFIESCRRLISYDSSVSHGNQEAADFVAQLCRDAGLNVETHEELHAGLMQVNVIARPSTAQRADGEFMLQAHLDTSDPGPFQSWTQNNHNPFDAVIVNGQLFGLGAADAKIDFLCKLEAFKQISHPQKWTLSPVLVGTYGEETGMLGAFKIIRKNQVNAKMALIGEPTSLRVVSAAKGFVNVEILIPFSEEEMAYRRAHETREGTTTESRLFRGKPAHSSAPQLGDSAILKMLEFLKNLPQNIAVMEIDGGVSTSTVPAHAYLEVEVAAIQSAVAPKILNIYAGLLGLENEFKEILDPEFQPSHPTLNLGMIRTHEDHVLLQGSCRLPPLVTQSQYEKWMDDLQVLCQKNGATFRITDYKRPFRAAPESILVKGCTHISRTLGLDNRVGTQASTNEASLFSRTGVDCVCFGAGLREANINTPHENVKTQDLLTAIEFYKKAIERFCL